MITPEQIPIPKEVATAVERLLNLYLVGGLTQSEGYSIGHALVEAALNAWPGAYQTKGYNTYFENYFDHVVIPLPQEPEA